MLIEILQILTQPGLAWIVNQQGPRSFVQSYDRYRVRLLLSCQGKNERDTSLDQTGANIGIRKKEADGKAALFQPVRSGPVGRSPVGDFGGHQVCVHMEIQRGEDRGDAGGKAGVMLLPHATKGQADPDPRGVLSEILQHPPVKRRADFLGPFLHFAVIVKQLRNIEFGMGK